MNDTNPLLVLYELFIVFIPFFKKQVRWFGLEVIGIKDAKSIYAMMLLLFF